jgi:metal-sulfur cluster biosynthetic enzyme
MVDRSQVLEALKNCYDPEIPINIVDLGLIYDLRVEGDKVFVRMTLTARGCPAHAFMKEEVERELLNVPGVQHAEVEVVWDPPWTPDRMSDEAKKALGYGAPQAPPVPLDFRPVQAGSTRSGSDGSILLVNGRGEAYRVSDHVKTIWELSDGSRTVKDIVDALADTLQAPPADLEQQVTEIILEMMRLGLLVNPDEFVQLDL